MTIAAQKPIPAKVTPQLFLWIQKLKLKNPHISADGLLKMTQNRISKSTLYLILKCSDYESYVFLLGKIAEIEKQRIMIRRLAHRVRDYEFLAKVGAVAGSVLIGLLFLALVFGRV